MAIQTRRNHRSLPTPGASTSVAILAVAIGVASGCYHGATPRAEGGDPGSSTGEPPVPADSSSGDVPEIPGTPDSTTASDDSGPNGSSSGASTVASASSDASSSGDAESSGGAPAWDPIVADGDRLFFVGNSYTGMDGGLPVHIEKAWPSATSPLTVETDARYYYGQGLGSMYTSDVISTIENGSFDTCAVTSGSLGDMLQFVPLVESNCDHFVVYMTWARNPTLTSMESYRQGTDEIVATMRELEEMTDAVVVPSGLIYYDLVARPPRDDLRLDWLYYPQNIHQNGAGMAINVYAFYAALVGESPVGIDYDFVLSYDGSVIVQDEQIATRWASDGSYLYDEIVFDEEFRTALQERAWEITTAWVEGTTEFD